MHKIYITESQAELIKVGYPVEPRKVLYVKDYLDKTFMKGTVGYVDDNGEWKNKPIVALVDASGNPVRNLTAEQLFYHVQSRFEDIYEDKRRRDAFLKAVVAAWYDNEISKEGLLKKNTY